MKASEALTVLEQLGSSQWGLATTGQAEVLGVSRVDLGRLCDAGAIQRIRRGVYALASSTYGPLQSVQAAWLATAPSVDAETRVMEGDDVVVSHFSAAYVHGLGDLIPVRHEFTSPRRRQTTQTDVRFHRLELSDEDLAVVDGLPVTSVLRTVADLAASRVDLDHLAGIVRDALSIPGTRRTRLATRLDPVSSRYGYDTGLALVDECLNRAGLPDVAADLLSPIKSAYMQNLNHIVQEYSRATAHMQSLNRIVQEYSRGTAHMQNLNLNRVVQEYLRNSYALVESPAWSQNLLPALHSNLYSNAQTVPGSVMPPTKIEPDSTAADEVEK
ncbi:type IV toxin-antitoxin system AbiEi family antitoxin domain-containing protein [Dermabacteraceae bacterium P13147]